MENNFHIWKKIMVKTANETIKLIDGEYTPQEAASILLAVIEEKIKYHNIQILSFEERFSVSNENSIKRLEELKQSREEICNLVELAKSENKSFKIKSNINIELV